MHEGFDAAGVGRLGRRDPRIDEIGDAVTAHVKRAHHAVSAKVGALFGKLKGLVGGEQPPLPVRATSLPLAAASDFEPAPSASAASEIVRRVSRRFPGLPVVVPSSSKQQSARTKQHNRSTISVFRSPVVFTR